MWSSHFRNMVNGQVPYQKNMYSLSSSGSVPSDLQLISPTKAVVERARSDLKRSLEDPLVYNSKKLKSTVQLGKGGRRNGGVKKRSKSKTSGRIKKNTQKTKKKKKKKKKKKSLKTKKKSSKTLRKKKKTTTRKKTKKSTKSSKKKKTK